MTDYIQFLETKQKAHIKSGFEPGQLPAPEILPPFSVHERDNELLID